jgi:hypothetical protein
MAPATGDSRSQALTKTLRDSHRDRQSDVTETQRHPAPFLARQSGASFSGFPIITTQAPKAAAMCMKQFLTIS